MLGKSRGKENPPSWIRHTHWPRRLWQFRKRKEVREGEKGESTVVAHTNMRIATLSGNCWVQNTQRAFENVSCLVSATKATFDFLSCRYVFKNDFPWSSSSSFPSCAAILWLVPSQVPSHTTTTTKLLLPYPKPHSLRADRDSPPLPWVSARVNRRQSSGGVEPTDEGGGVVWRGG